MTVYYSVTTGGFYDSDVYTTLLDDAVEITPQTHKALLTANAQGYPQAIFLASDEVLATTKEMH